MFIEIWEKLRGYDKWIETNAVIVSGERIRRKFGLPAQRSNSQFSSDLLLWTDSEGEKHFGPFVNLDTSPLFQLLEGETISIRYNPSRPDRFYNREYFQCWVALITKAMFAAAIGGGFIVWRVWSIIARRGL